MDLYKVILNIIFLGLGNSLVIKNRDDNAKADNDKSNIKEIERIPDNVFNGVYSECFLHLSYSCLQTKTLLYLKELNNLSEVSVIGDYVKFVRINTTNLSEEDDSNSGSTDELALMIDKAVDDFFDNHVLKFNALGRDISIPRNMEEFVGRKKRKGGGGGGGIMMMGGHGGGHDDGGKKKMMMMAMMCMKMKLMMMIPAMMGMMGMMSFKGMMFSMMSFMLSKMMLLMKILEKKGGAGGFGGGGGGGDGGWAAGGGSGGAWMPAGGQDFGGGGGGGGGGGYDANGQWQSRSIIENLPKNEPNIIYRHFIDENLKQHTKPYSLSNNDDTEFNGGDSHRAVKEKLDYANMPEMSYVKPVVRYNNKIKMEVLKKPVLVYKKSNVDFSNYQPERNIDIDSIKNEDEVNSPDIYSRSKRSIIKDEAYLNGEHIKETKNGFVTDEPIGNNNEKQRLSKFKTRTKRSILDLLQNSYMYWMNRILGVNNNRRTNFQKYKVINGVRYVYYPFKAQRPKMPKEIQLTSPVKLADEFKPIITAEDFNKGEIMEGAVESRMIKKKFQKMKDTMNETVDTIEENPWE